jgi:hypothetical protein
MNHVVSDGDCLQSVSALYGIDDSSVIWNHRENAGLKASRA